MYLHKCVAVLGVACGIRVCPSLDSSYIAERAYGTHSDGKIIESSLHFTTSPAVAARCK